MVNLGRPLARHAANRSSEVLAQHQDARSTSFSSATLPAPTCHDRVARAKEAPKIDERGGKIVHNFVRNNSERTIEFDLNSFHLSVSHAPFKRCFVKLLSRFILFIRILRAYPPPEFPSFVRTLRICRRARNFRHFAKRTGGASDAQLVNGDRDPANSTPPVSINNRV